MEITPVESVKKVETNGVSNDTKKLVTSSNSHSTKRKTEVSSRESQRKEERKEEPRSKDRKDQRVSTRVLTLRSFTISFCSQESPSSNKWERDRFDEGTGRFRDNADGEVSSLSNSSPSASQLGPDNETGTSNILIFWNSMIVYFMH